MEDVYFCPVWPLLLSTDLTALVFPNQLNLPHPPNLPTLPNLLSHGEEVLADGVQVLGDVEVHPVAQKGG